MGRVSIEGTRVVDESALPGVLGRSLLAVLAMQRGPVGRSELADMLWDGDPPDEFDRSLRPLLSKLRSALAAAGGGRDLISSGSGSVELRRKPTVWVDAEEATTRLDAAEGALRRGDLRPAWVQAAVASSILTRPFLPGVHSRWADERRRLAASRLVRAYEVAVDVWFGLDQPGQAVVAAERLVEADRYRETSHERLMRAHLEKGNRAEALRAFAQLERTLREELGISPSPGVQRAYEEALGWSS